MEVKEDVVVIVGGGISGLATAVALHRLGIKSLVLERSQGLRATGAALTLFPNAWLALDALGVAPSLTSTYFPIKRGWVTDVKTGTVQEVIYGGGNSGVGIGPKTIHRKALLEALADQLPNGTIRFSSKVTGIEGGSGSPVAGIHLDDGTTIKAKILIGCDGVHSVVANWLGLAAPLDSGRSAFRGLAVYPQGHGFTKDIHQFVDTGIRAGIVPLTDKEIYWFFVYQSFPHGDAMSRNPEEMQRQLLENYAKNMPQQYLDVVQHCDLSTLTWAPLMFRSPLDIMLKKLSRSNITVAGDAMHAMTPDLGQGGGSSLEDAVVFGQHVGRLLLKNGKLDSESIKDAIDGYVKQRKWRVSWLVIGSYLSGWVQQGGSNNWLMKFLRDGVFYRFLLPWLVDTVNYDCGKLPSVKID